MLIKISFKTQQILAYSLAKISAILSKSWTMKTREFVVMVIICIKFLLRILKLT